MKFRKFGKTLLLAALSAGVLFGFTSCTQSYTVGFLYVTGLDTANLAGEGLISGFKIDHNTGKLTPMHGLPVGSGGSNPSRAVLLGSGRFLYVLNQGVTATNGLNCTVADPCSGGNISQFLLGGNGVLTFEQSFSLLGTNPIRLISDPVGNYLMVLQQLAPSPSSTDTIAACTAVVKSPTCGAITVFQINQATGRLSLVQNAQLTSASNSLPLTYFPVPLNPIDFVYASGTVLTLAAPPSAPGDVYFPYGFGGGQLVETTYSVATNVLTNGNGTPMQAATAIVQASNYVYVLDNEPLSGSSSLSQILPYTVSGGSMTSVVGGVVADIPTLSDPVYLLQEAKGGYLYVLNDAPGPAVGNPASGIANYVIDATSHQLTPAAKPMTGSGSIPKCMIEDPSGQFIYTADFGSSTVTGYVFDPNTGELINLRQSKTSTTFPLPGPGTWCVQTGRTN